MKNSQWQVSEFHENGSKKTELLDLGYRVKYIKYYEGGEIHITGGLVEGKPEGLHVIYFRSGGLEITVNYISGVKEGQEIKYYESGEKLQVANYKNGKYEGKITAYFKNGNIQSLISVVKELRFGETLEYYESGSIRVVRDFSSHDVQEATGFYESGVIQSKATLINNELDGIFEGYDENGNLAIKQLYKDGELVEDEFTGEIQSNSMQDVKEPNIGFEDAEREANKSIKNRNEIDPTKKIENQINTTRELRKKSPVNTPKKEQVRAREAINELQTLTNEVVELLNNSTK